MFKIGDFSKLTRVSIRMLRHYDEVNLLKPSHVDSFTGYRYYTADQIPRINRILALKDMGFSLSEIFALMEKDYDKNQLLTFLHNRRHEITDLINKESEKLLRVENFIKFINQEDLRMNHEITLKEIPAYRVLSLRGIIPAYNAEGTLWEELQTFVSERQIKCNTPCYAIYHDPGYKESDVDVEVTMCVDESVQGNNRILCKELKAVPNMAVIMYSGPFEAMMSAYHSLGVWLAHNGYSMDGPIRAIYHKGPWNESSPENYLTEIQAPVVKKLA